MSNLFTLSHDEFVKVQLTEANNTAIPLPQLKVGWNQTRTNQDCCNDSHHKIGPCHALVIWNLLKVSLKYSHSERLKGKENLPARLG